MRCVQLQVYRLGTDPYCTLKFDGSQIRKNTQIHSADTYLEVIISESTDICCVAQGATDAYSSKFLYRMLGKSLLRNCVQRAAGSFVVCLHNFVG